MTFGSERILQATSIDDILSVVAASTGPTGGEACVCTKTS
jgi:hypothetical protein